MNETAGIGELTGPISDIICKMNSFLSARNSTNDASNWFERSGSCARLRNVCLQISLQFLIIHYFYQSFQNEVS